MKIETTRCLLEELKPDDADNFLRLHTDPEVRKYLGGPADSDTVKQTFSRLLEHSQLMPCWAVRVKDQPAMIGLISLSRHHDGKDTELSFQFLPEAWHHGYGIECVGAALEQALTKFRLRRVISETQTDNQPARRLLEGLGMWQIGSLERFGAQQTIYAVVID